MRKICWFGRMQHIPKRWYCARCLPPRNFVSLLMQPSDKEVWSPLNCANYTCSSHPLLYMQYRLESFLLPVCTQQTVSPARRRALFCSLARMSSSLSCNAGRFVRPALSWLLPLARHCWLGETFPLALRFGGRRDVPPGSSSVDLVHSRLCPYALVKEQKPIISPWAAFLPFV